MGISQGKTFQYLICRNIYKKFISEQHFLTKNHPIIYFSLSDGPNNFVIDQKLYSNIRLIVFLLFSSFLFFSLLFSSLLSFHFFSYIMRSRFNYEQLILTYAFSHIFGRISESIIFFPFWIPFRQKQYMEKYRHYILYIIFVVLTTLVNVVTYYLAHIFLPVMPSTVMAWILAVLFAYITNRRFVFGSQAKTKQEIIKEIISFFSARILTGILDVALMFIFVDCLKMNDMVIKVISNIIVIVLNYVSSKVFVFRKKN